MSFGAGLKIGFGVVLLLLVAVTATGLARMASINQRMEQVVRENNVKTALAHDIKDAMRDRAIIMHSITLLTDAFEQLDELDRFNEKGSAFTSARNRLTQMKLSAEEEKILGGMREVTLKTQPLVVQAIDMAMVGKTEIGRAHV